MVKPEGDEGDQEVCGQGQAEVEARRQVNEASAPAADLIMI